MKYNSIGEQLVAKAKELDPSYKPDKFNDMSEAINIILNNSGSGSSSAGGKLEGFSIDVSDTYNSETKEFSGTLTDEQWAKVQNEQIYWIEVVYINNQETGEEASTTLLYNGPLFVEARAFGDGNGSIMFIHDKSIAGVIIKAALTIDTQGTPTSQLIPSITTSNEQQNLTIGNGLEIKNGALEATGSGGGGQSIEDLPVVILTGDTTTITDEAIKAKILENINNNNYLICKLKLNLLAPVEVLITRDTKIPSNDTINDMMFTTIAYIDLGLVASTINFMLLISSTDGTISAVFKMFDYVKGDQISLFQKGDGAFGVTTDYGDTNNINGLTFYFDTINGKPIIHKDTAVNNYNIPTIPTLPSDASTKTYALKAVNGVLTWVE